MRGFPSIEASGNSLKFDKLTWEGRTSINSLFFGNRGT